MCNDVAVHSKQHLSAHSDPTRTTTLRIAFIREARRRFRVIINLINKAIVEEDVFALINPTTYGTPGRRAFNFPTSSQKVQAFMDWLNQQVQNEILAVTQFQQVGQGAEYAWTNIYIQDSYKRGVTRARYDMTRAGFDVPPLTATGGIEASLALPFHVDRLGLLYMRTFNELRGVTAAMDQQISRILAQGLADGIAPRTLAKNIVHTITGTGGDLATRDTLGRFIPARRRAEMIARTETIRAHAQAQLIEFKNWGVEGVNVQAEFVTAGDNRVCPQCTPLEGNVYSIQDAMNIIPVHVSCRCAWLPYKKPE